MFHQIVFIILLLTIFIITTYSDIRLYYHLLYKKDYLKWTSQNKNDFQDTRALLGEQKFKIFLAGIFGITIACIILVQFALFWLSKSLNEPVLTHVAATSLLLVILENFVSIFTYPIPGVTTFRLRKDRILFDIGIAIANYCCLVYMMIQVIILLINIL